MSIISHRLLKAKKGVTLYNAIGTTNDPKPYIKDYHITSWIINWELNSHERLGSICPSCGQETGRKFGWGIIPERFFVGGHVTIQDLNAGEILYQRDRVFIAPICNICNTSEHKMVLKRPVILVHLIEFNGDAQKNYKIQQQYDDYCEKNKVLALINDDDMVNGISEATARCWQF